MNLTHLQRRYDLFSSLAYFGEGSHGLYADKRGVKIRIGTGKFLYTHAMPDEVLASHVKRMMDNLNERLSPLSIVKSVAFKNGLIDYTLADSTTVYENHLSHCYHTNISQVGPRLHHLFVYKNLFPEIELYREMLVRERAALKKKVSKPLKKPQVKLD